VAASGGGKADASLSELELQSSISEPELAGEDTVARYSTIHEHTRLPTTHYTDTQDTAIEDTVGSYSDTVDTVTCHFNMENTVDDYSIMHNAVGCFSTRENILGRYSNTEDVAARYWAIEDRAEPYFHYIKNDNVASYSNTLEHCSDTEDTLGQYSIMEGTVGPFCDMEGAVTRYWATEDIVDDYFTTMDTVARYSASSDSEMSVELPSCASSSDKPTSFDWALPLPTAGHDETVHDDETTNTTRRIARRASQEDLEDQNRSASRFVARPFYPFCLVVCSSVCLLFTFAFCPFVLYGLLTRKRQSVKKQKSACTFSIAGVMGCLHRPANV